jgi:hypothetical protein
MGKLKVNRVGGGAVNALDDKLPTAWEEASDNSAHDFIGENVGSGNDDGAISYHLPTLSFEGNTIDIGVDYDPASGVAAGGTGSVQQTGATFAAGAGIAGFAPSLQLGCEPYLSALPTVICGLRLSA